MNGMAAQRAASKIRSRLVEFAAAHFAVTESDVYFHNNNVRIGQHTLPFEELVQLAWFARVSLSATGYYRTPKIHYDRSTFSGRPFYYFAYGASVSEVVIDTLTGENRLLRVDILHDCGRSLNPAIDLGQIEGGFIQGAGWLTTEELYWDEGGALKTHAPSTYKIPVCSDVPVDFRVKLLESATNREQTIYRSKAVGEPPFMLALSVFHAIRDAVAAAGETHPELSAPATPEAILGAISSADVTRGNGDD
jgi:xanthine dehydrogenase large subunit